jgi:2-dehydropantoate 2-reductase
MRYVVYGAGAVGGVVGGYLSRSGLPTTLVARGEHLRTIRNRGLLLDTPVGTYVIEASTVASAAEIDWTDQTVVLLCVKSQHTAAALEDLRAHVPSDAIVVSVQNGIANEEQILRLFARTYSAWVMVPANHLEPGLVVQRAIPVPGIIDFGHYPDGVDEVASTISADLAAAGFSSEVRPDITACKRRKLIANLANGIDAICRAGPVADYLILRAQVEAEGVFAIAGLPVITAAADAERRGAYLRRRQAGDIPDHSSTWQSLARRSPSVEVDYLNGEVVFQGRLSGVPTPVNELVQQAVHELLRTGAAPGSIDPDVLLAQLD